MGIQGQEVCSLATKLSRDLDRGKLANLVLHRYEATHKSS